MRSQTEITSLRYSMWEFIQRMKMKVFFFLSQRLTSVNISKWTIITTSLVPRTRLHHNRLVVMLYLIIHAGAVTISSLRYENSAQTLVCTSTGGPATSVSWTKNNITLLVDGTTYQRSQVITDTVTATYENRLTIVSKTAHLSGVYSCYVQNRRGNGTKAIEINGKW